jgi:spore coat protein H
VFQIEGKLRGASSLSYPKKSFTLNFGGAFDDPARGFVGEKKIVLTTTFDDNSQLRTLLSWQLWNRLQPTVRVAATLAVVYLDGAYHGLYTMTDHIDDELMESHGLPESGNLYKAINHDANFSTTAAGGGAKTTLHDGYEKKHGLPDPGQPGAFDDLDALVAFVSGADDASFRLEIGERVHLPDFEAWWLFAVFSRAQDSAGKNSYLHHSAVTKWHAVPWDFNETFGQSWYTTREPYAPIYRYDRHNRLFARLLADPELGPALTARFAAELDGGAFDLDALLARIDGLAAVVAPSAGRDERRWRQDYLTFSRWSFRDDFTTFREEVDYVKAWLTGRWQALAAEMR